MDSYRERMVYFARPKHFYPYEALNRLILETAASEAMGWPRHFRILDPNDEMLDKVYNNLKRLNSPDAFQLFTLISRACDHILGVAFSDGVLGAGVANEIAAYYNIAPTLNGRPRITWTAVPLRRQDDPSPGRWGKPAIYRHTSFDSVKSMHKILTIPDTRERIKNGVL